MRGVYPLSVWIRFSGLVSSGIVINPVIDDSSSGVLSTKTLLRVLANSPALGNRSSGFLAIACCKISLTAGGSFVDSPVTFAAVSCRC